MSVDVALQQLPGAIRERVRRVTGDAEAVGDYVLYWMHHAVRGHENPALDGALLLASELELPLLVYQDVLGDPRFASDRHLTFALEGARDARVELTARGLTHVVALGASPGRPDPLDGLAAEAALVVTEEFPVPPFPGRVARLADTGRGPILAVDTACVVPMRLVDRWHDRAFRFRAAIRDLLAERLERPWAEVEAELPSFDRSRLPFRDPDLENESIADLVARCPVDHAVGPVAHTRGGAAAGYARWASFRDRGLRSYAARRNDAAIDGVSRLSPYLHHGHVSSLRIAREAAAIGGKGAEKFLDELIVWRELAHNLCFHRHDELERPSVLSDWALATLAEHLAGGEEGLSWERLARGRTGDRLWDLCQASLIRHGELHNNVRMTWGKAIPGWAGDIERALELLIDLNHRYALDGSDPNSYGGLLWCLGLFDRPFTPPRPPLGTVRSRPTKGHADRLDLDRFAARVLAPATGRPLEVAVVGAGMSGLACARSLADHGHRVRVFEKARGVGGRMSTRRAGEMRFDHGAQYFTARDPRFARWVASWRRQGLVARWRGTIAVLGDGGDRGRDDAPARFVGVPGMNAICRHLAVDLDVVLGAPVGAVDRRGGRWRLATPDGADLGGWDALVVSAPAPQAAALLADAAPGMARRAKAVELSPCWAVMAAFDRRLGLDWDAAFVHGSPLAWVARNASKPGRPQQEAWVFHAAPGWTSDNLERSPEEVAAELLPAFAGALDAPLPEPVHLAAHRWRFALPQPLDEPCLFDPELLLAACGDWCAGPQVEGAFLSGCAAAGRLLALRPEAEQAALFGDG